MKSLVSKLAGTAVRGLGNVGKEQAFQSTRHSALMPKKTIEIRDWWQSGAKAVPKDMHQPDSGIMQYIGKVNELYHKDAPIKSVVAFMGTWYELFAMNNVNPFGFFRNVIAATPTPPGKEPLPIEQLLRSDRYGLARVNKEVLYAVHKKQAEIAGPDRQIIERTFHFNNRAMYKADTYAGVKRLREEGVTNFVISDEHSYSDFMSSEHIAEGIVRGLLRNVAMTSGDTSYPIQGGIKDYSGGLAPEDAEATLRSTVKLMKEVAHEMRKNGYAVDADRLENATLTLHSHLTKRSKDTVSTFERVGKELGVTVTTHGIHNVENATHHVIGDEGLTPEQLVVQRESEAALAGIIDKNKKQIVEDYTSGMPRDYTGMAGGGKPMIEGYVDNIAMLQKRKDSGDLSKALSKDERESANVLLHRYMNEIRVDNLINTVTPAQKATADMGKMYIENQGSGKPRYSGTHTPEVIDVVLDLDPSTVKHKDLLESVYRQNFEAVLTRYEKEGAITPELKAALLKVGMNSERTSLDQDQIQKILVEHLGEEEKRPSLKLGKLFEDMSSTPATALQLFEAFVDGLKPNMGNEYPPEIQGGKEPIQAEIIEATGRATRPAPLPDQMGIARQKVAQVKLELQVNNLINEIMVHLDPAQQQQACAVLNTVVKDKLKVAISPKDFEDKQGLREKLAVAIQDTYPEQQNKMNAFLESVQKLESALSDKHPLKAYTTSGEVQLNMPEDEAVLVIASLPGRNTGFEYVKRQAGLMPLVQEVAAPVKPQPILAQLWLQNVAGDVLKEVMNRPPVSEVEKAQKVATVKEAPQLKVG